MLRVWGSAGLYRPGRRPENSPDSRSIWNGELSLANELPMDSWGWYTAGRMADMGSLSCRPDWVTCAGTLELDGSPGR